MLVAAGFPELSLSSAHMLWFRLAVLLHVVWQLTSAEGSRRQGRRDRTSNYQQEEPCKYTNQEELNSFLWTIQRNPPSYFFGTIHVPYTRVWDFIPSNSKQAFHQSNHVFVELDLTDPYTVSALSSCQMLPEGKSLGDVLPEDIYRRLKQHLKYVKNMMPLWVTADQRGRGLYADYLFNAITGNWERKRPVWVMLMVNSLTEVDVRTRGIPVLDLFLAQEAARLNKRTGAVEKVEEQCMPLNGLNISQVLFALNQTLWQQENIRSGQLPMSFSTDDLIHHYNCGDLNTIIFDHHTAQVPNLLNTSLSPPDLEQAQQIDEYFRTELILLRNQRMAGRVSKLLQDHPNDSFFFAFGAGHFIGNNTVIDLLRRNGLDIAYVPSNVTLNTSNSDQSATPPTFPSLRTRLTSLFCPDNNGKPRNCRRRRKKRRRIHRENERPRQFNDLWIRIEESDSPSTTSQSPTEVPPRRLYSLQRVSSRRSVSSRCTHTWWLLTIVALAAMREPLLLVMR
ncbi:metalloprotease TIKI1-like [Branchiostoma floridae x Branchiostoma belcheri]